MKKLLLWLEAPLQAWGADSRFGRRDTLPFPTRSGILGMLCCAMGRGDEQREWLAAMKGLDQTVVAYAREKKNKEALRQPLLRDFHMIGSGYDRNDNWQDMLIPKKADGTRPVGAGTKLTHRYYLQDMAFACVLDVPDALCGELERGLAAPVWPVFLGRRACVPTDVIFRGFFDGEDSAFACAADIAAEKKRKAIFKVLGGRHDEGTVMTLNDVPLCFGLRKRFEERLVTVAEIEPPEDPSRAGEEEESAGESSEAERKTGRYSADPAP